MYPGFFIIVSALSSAWLCSKMSSLLSYDLSSYSCFSILSSASPLIWISGQVDNGSPLLFVASPLLTTELVNFLLFTVVYLRKVLRYQVVQTLRASRDLMHWVTNTAKPWNDVRATKSISKVFWIGGVSWKNWLLAGTPKPHPKPRRTDRAMAAMISCLIFLDLLFLCNGLISRLVIKRANMTINTVQLNM